MVSAPLTGGAEPTPGYSVILRSRNDAAIIGKTLAGIFSQTLQPAEIICMENASTDGTRGILAKHEDRIRIVEVPEAQYLPGKVLNQGVEEARTDIIVFLNSDAVPLHPDCFMQLIRDLSPGAVAYARQVVRPGARIAVRYDHDLCFPPKPPPGSLSRCGNHFFSIVCAAAHKTLLVEQPLPEDVRYSEDSLWAQHLADRGRSIEYRPNARVEHSHNYTFRQAVKRFYNEGKCEGVVLAGVARAAMECVFAPVRIARSLYKDIRYAKAHRERVRLAELSYSLQLRTAQKLVKPAASLWRAGSRIRK